MARCLLANVVLLVLSTGAWAQDDGPDDVADVSDEAEAAEDAPAEDEIDVSELEQESYADAEEEDFVPTEDIPTDQAIPFPTDI